MPPHDTGTWMWAQACEMLERAERLHRQFFQLGRSQAGRTTWEPPCDIFETECELWILAALPGVGPGDLQVTIEGGALTVTGERPLPVDLRGATVHRLEIPHGHFERRIALPPGRVEIGRRELLNGCLFLSLRKLG